MAAARRQGGETLVAKLYDITDRPSGMTLPEPVAQVECSDQDVDVEFAIPTADRDYMAAVGYQTGTDSWLSLAQSEPIRVASSIPGAAILGGAAAGAAVAAGLGAAQDQPTDQGNTQTVKVHSRKNSLMFDAEQLHHIEQNVASTYHLPPGLYSLKIKEGVFNYDGDDNHPGEAFVLLWIHGGTVINPKTGIPVSSTWTTLNGYSDSLTLTVREPATLCAFFVDTYPDDNTGEVTLEITKHEEV